MDRPSTPLIFLAASADLATTVKAIKAGAVEFFTKPFCAVELVSAIREALEQPRSSRSRSGEAGSTRPPWALSRREREVMALVAPGLLNKQVGGELGISEIIVKKHRAQVMQKRKGCEAGSSVDGSVRDARHFDCVANGYPLTEDGGSS